jgi:hypothetical protein
MVAGKPFGVLTVARPNLDDGSIAIIRPHPSNPTSTVGYIVARVCYASETSEGRKGNRPTVETEAYARLFAAAPEMAEALRGALQAWDNNPITKQRRIPEPAWLTGARALLARIDGE